MSQKARGSDRKPAEFTKLNSCVFKITWDLLYREIYQPFADQKPPLIKFTFLRDIVPSDFAKAFLCSNKGDYQNKYCSIVCRAEDSSMPQFEKARSYLVNLRTRDYEKYRYDTSPVIRQFQSNWERMVPRLKAVTPDREDALWAALDDLLASIPEEDEPLNIYLRINPLFVKGEYSLVLALLSVMASTLFCFNKLGGRRDENSDLHYLVLPPVAQQEESEALKEARELLDDSGCSFEKYSSLLKGSLNRAAEKQEARYLLYMKAKQSGIQKGCRSSLTEAAAAGFEPALKQLHEEAADEKLRKVSENLRDPAAVSSRKIKESCELCEEIIRMSPPVSAGFRGPASFILYRYTLSCDYTPPSGETAYQFLEIAHNCGYEHANAPWEKHNTVTVTPTYVRSKDSSRGICYFNANNSRTEVFCKTVPLKTWELASLNLQTWDPAAAGSEGKAMRILLVDDNFSKNLSDLFSVLQKIKSSNSEIRNIEIFIRHNSDTARSLIDTAVSHMGECLIPIHLINDARSAAQQLLSRHPLFYPLTRTKFTSSWSTSDVLHFVIVGTSEVAQWLIREAFWLMGDRSSTLKFKITLLAPEGERFVAGLKSQYPGMIRDRFHIPGIEIPEIVGKDIDFDSEDLLNQVAEIVRQTPSCYFAVAEEDAMANLTLAMRIREAAIRTCIAERVDPQSGNPFPIAFYCNQEEIAWLSRSLVIETETQGHKWYNTWALIPFGEISHRYTWEEIDGGTFRQLALCIHYQYSGIARDTRCADVPSAGTDKMTNAQRQVFEAKKDFFARQYNQDSSYSMAISLPYRLFQFSGSDGHRIFPLAWSILDETVFSNANQLRLLAARIRDFHINEAELEEIARFEHARWVKWLLSRGWLPASADDSVFSFANGNPRQQLFVARLHPCLDSYDNLAGLSKTLWEKCGIRKDFYRADLENVKATKDLLSLAWIRENEHGAVR